MFWGNPEDESSLYKELERLEKSKCNTCSKLAKYEFCHYGDINDCLDRYNKIEYNQFEKRFIIPKNHKGNVILRSKPSHVKAPKSILDKRIDEVLLDKRIDKIEKLEKIHKQKGIRFENKGELESLFRYQDNIKIDNLMVSHGNLGYMIIFDNGGGYEVVLRMKENVARELRDKLNALLPINESD